MPPHDAPARTDPGPEASGRAVHDAGAAAGGVAPLRAGSGNGRSNGGSTGGSAGVGTGGATDGGDAHTARAGHDASDGGPPRLRRRGGGPLYAALDLGTNNCRLLVATPAADGFRVVDSYSRIVRLGEGLAASGCLSDAAMGRAVAALRACAEKLARRPVQQFRAVATEACRRAANAPEFLGRVAAETGLALDVIGPREEAELAVDGCAGLLADGAERRALLFDIGGGSTEIMWLRLAAARNGGRPRPELIGFVSLPIGVISLAERFGADAFTHAGFEAMVELVMAAARPFEAVHCIGHEIGQGGVRLLGTSGTVTTLAGVALGLDRYRRTVIDGHSLPAAEAEAALEGLVGRSRASLATEPCIGQDRSEFVLPGCAIFAAIRRLWPIERLTVADRGLREGILLRMMRGETPRAVRRGGPARTRRPGGSDA